MKSKETMPIDFLRIFFKDYIPDGIGEEEHYASRKKLEAAIDAWETVQEWLPKGKVKWERRAIEKVDYYDNRFAPLTHWNYEYYPVCPECKAKLYEGYNYCPNCCCELEWTKKPVDPVPEGNSEEREKERIDTLKYITEALNDIKENENEEGSN